MALSCSTNDGLIHDLNYEVSEMKTLADKGFDRGTLTPVNLMAL